jgi:predicted RNase H-like HicB family nuclease
VYVGPTGEASWRASLAELPGCMAAAATKEDAVARLREAFPDYVALLERHDALPEHARGLDPARFEVREVQAHAYPEDFRGMQEHELRDFLHQYEALHHAALELVEGLSQEQLERDVGDGEWSLREVLEHIATGGLSILAQLEPWPAGGFGSFNAAHRVVVQRFSAMDATDTQGEHRVFGRRVSVKKVARRLLEHEYEHLRQLREAIAKLGTRA